MRKYFCDRCGTEIDMDAIQKYHTDCKSPYEVCVDHWVHEEHGWHHHEPMELCVDCKIKLDDVVERFMTNGVEHE